MSPPRGEVPNAALADAREVMDRALSSERGITVSFVGERHCKQFRQRLYSARKRDRTASRQIWPLDDPRFNRTPYDELSFNAEADRSGLGWNLVITKGDHPFGLKAIEEL